MKILSIRAKNYRSLEDIELDLSKPYTAICGPNDCGKTNVIRALRSFVSEVASLRMEWFDDDEVSLEEDFPKWKASSTQDKRIELGLTLEVDPDRDAAFFHFIKKNLSLQGDDGRIVVAMRETFTASKSETPDVVVEVAGKVFDGLPAQEVRKRLRNSRAILFHNSTENVIGFPVRSSAGALVQAEQAGHGTLLANLRKTVDRGLEKVAKTHKKELEGLLGRLQTKYQVGLSMPSFDFAMVPLRMTLGQRQLQVPLDAWGSGTRNRTLILMALFRARQMSEMAASAEKITPAIVVEEPESFLHPSAQAEFGRVLQDLAEEFGVQVIVTTHSPYLLNLREPAANVLLCREERRGQLQETKRADTTGDMWMAPFASALGLDSGEFEPWKTLLTSPSDAVLLVEGDTDKEYFELLRNPAHGQGALRFEGEIIPYEGVGNLQNPILLKFARSRYRKTFLTFDLDAQQLLERTVKLLALEKRKDYDALGVDEAGRRSIEGLLPREITQAVYSDHHEVVQALASDNRQEQADAKRQIKTLLLERFKNVAVPGETHFGAFYKVTKVINHALR